MKAIQYDEFGSVNVLKLVDIPTPLVGEGEVLVRIEAAGVNPVDAKIRKGLLTSRVPAEFPIVPGWDLSGIVVDRGFAARRFKVGDSVIGYCRRPTIHSGTYAEYISIPECYLALAPTSIPLNHAAGLPLAGLTAFQAIFDFGRLRKGETIVILGASGGVGLNAIQLAVDAGATVVAVASSRNKNILQDLGATYFIDYTTESIQGKVKELFPEGVDLVFDCVGGDTFTECFSYVNRNGRVVTLLVNIPERQNRPNPEIEYHYCFVEPNSSELEHLSSLVDRGALNVFISEEFHLQEAHLAQERIEKGHGFGKIIINITP